MALEQHVVVLDFIGTNDDYALYHSTEIEGREPLKLLMPLVTYADMGQREQITIAVRPGSAFTDLDVAFQHYPAE